MAGNDQVIRPDSDTENSDNEMYMAERAPSDPAIRGLYQLLDHKFQKGATIESMQADYILPNFTPGNTRYRTTLGLDSYNRRSSSLETNRQTDRNYPVKIFFK